MSRLLALSLLVICQFAARADNMIWSNPGCWNPGSSCGLCGPGYGPSGVGCGNSWSNCFGCGLSPGYQCSSFSMCFGNPGRSYGYQYVSWYDLPCAWGWMPSCSRWNYANCCWLGNGYVESTSACGCFKASKPQIIHFDKPLAAGAATIRIESPAGAEVLVQGKRVNDVYLAENLKGPTKIEFIVRQTGNGQAKEVAHPVTVSPGERKQLVILR